jgi:hypothetical protein
MMGAANAGPTPPQMTLGIITVRTPPLWTDNTSHIPEAIELNRTTAGEAGFYADDDTGCKSGILQTVNRAEGI